MKAVLTLQYTLQSIAMVTLSSATTKIKTVAINKHFNKFEF